MTFVETTRTTDEVHAWQDAPTLNVAGALDRCTPPGQAEEFHRALLANGVESELVVYPREGHGVVAQPALADFRTRVTEWFHRFMPARSRHAVANEEWT